MYPSNKIEMKGFLSGYLLMQGTSPGVELNFTMSVKNSSHFTTSISVPPSSSISHMTFYRMGYDRSAIERSSYQDVFHDFHYELVNGTNMFDIYSAEWAGQF